MKTKILLSLLSLGLILSAFGQNTVELTFTAIDSADYTQLDSIKVMNRTQGGDTVLYYPDTILILDYQVGISEIKTGNEGFQVFQNYPNPVIDQTIISFYLPEKDYVTLIVTDMLGRSLIETKRILDQGYHSYRFTPGNGNLFVLTVQWKGNSSSIKILKIYPVSGNSSRVEYIGSEGSSPKLKITEAIQSFPFNLGDELLFIGYTDTLQSGMVNLVETSQLYEFQFAINIPCPGTPTVTYEGHVYNTIQILSQCWFKENLDIGTMIQGNQEMTDNDTIEKYCYNNESDSCVKYGGFYQWNELMQYSTEPGAQGICPPGWHIPTEEDWKVVEGAADSQFEIGSSEWDIYLWRGFDSGKNLKSASGWAGGGNGTDSLGFSALPAGYRTDGGAFIWILTDALWWSSSERDNTTSWGRHLTQYSSKSGRGWRTKNYGGPIRCIKDN